MTDVVWGSALRTMVEALAPPITADEVMNRISSGPVRPWAEMRSMTKVVLVAATLVAIVSIGYWRAPPVNAVEIVEEGDSVTVWLTGEGDATSVTRALQEAGFDVTVEAVPVSPSRVGRFVAAGGALPPLELLGVDGATFQGFRVREPFGGHFDLYYGRNAREGEQYVAGGSAYEVGEPLHCVAVWGLPVEAALPMLEEAVGDFRVRWQTLDAEGSGLIEVDPTNLVGAYVTDALAVGPREILIYAAPTAASLFGREPPDLGACDQ